MTVPTVDQGSRGSPANPRAHSLTRRIAELDAARADDGRLEALALGLVDALLDADETTLNASLDALRHARGRAVAGGRVLGWLEAMIASTQWALERLTPESTLGAVPAGSQAHAFLQALDRSPQLGSSELRELLGTDETQVSRTGRRLLEAGLVSRRKLGRQVFWELTPRGRSVLDSRPAGDARRGSFWMEAIRRGFAGAAGDEPGELRQVDPERERIVGITLGLHKELGIQATTWPQIAGRAGVPMETLEALFASEDELIAACAQHFLEGLRLPPPERAPEIFKGAASEHERVHRLVDTIFAAYEREGDGLEAGRRERTELPIVDEGLEQVDVTLDALVAEALRPRDPDAASVASVRALTDVTMWRVLRDDGASAPDSVDKATGIVERWLDAQPAHA